MPQRFGFNLADALARDVQLLADLFERVLALAAYAEAQADDFLFFRKERLEDWTFSTGISMRREISSLVGARPQFLFQLARFLPHDLPPRRQKRC